MLNEHDIAACEWCHGDGKDHASLGQPTVRDCPRCAGSGRVYVTSRESATSPSTRCPRTMNSGIP